MRLVCPNCAAQYEVAEDTIPATGRDVQCASCGKTWFQPPASAFLQAAAEAVTSGSDAEAEEAADTTDDDGPPPEFRRARPKSSVDPSVLDILRREAEREADVRVAEEAEDAAEEAAAEEEGELPAEDQPEAAAEAESDSRSLAERARDARARLNANRDSERRAAEAEADEPEYEDTGYEEDTVADIEEAEEEDELTTPEADVFDDVPAPAAELPEETAAPAVAPAPRRPARPDRPKRDLPDVDELNSTLRSASDKGRAQEQDLYSDTGQARSGTGRIGFYLAVLLTLILMAVYALAPQITAAVPAAAGAIDGFVSVINMLRQGLDGAVTWLIETATNLLKQFL